MVKIYLLFFQLFKAFEVFGHWKKIACYCLVRK